MKKGGIDVKKFIFISSVSDLDSAFGEKDSKIILIPARNKDLLIGKNIDLFVNIASFQEMNEQLVSAYFRIIKSNGSYLYCCNREDKTLRGGERLIFDCYPWGNGEKLVWEDCPWYKKFYSFRPPFIHRYDGKIKHALVKYHLEK